MMTCKTAASTFGILATFIFFLLAGTVRAQVPAHALSASSPGEAKAELSNEDMDTDEYQNEDEADRLLRSLHGMTMTFIQFAEEHEVDAYETGRWTGRFLTRYVEDDETFTPEKFLAWMEDELAMHQVRFEVLETGDGTIEARRQRVFTREKLPWFYRYDITLGEYEAFYHGALTEIAKAYGVSYEQRQEGDLVLLTIAQK